MDDIYKNIEEYNPGKKQKNSIVFGVIIAEVHNNEKLSKIVTELFIRGVKLNISFAFSSRNHVLKDQKILD